MGNDRGAHQAFSAGNSDMHPTGFGFEANRIHGFEEPVTGCVLAGDEKIHFLQLGDHLLVLLRWGRVRILAEFFDFYRRTETHTEKTLLNPVFYRIGADQSHPGII